METFHLPTSIGLVEIRHSDGLVESIKFCSSAKSGQLILSPKTKAGAQIARELKEYFSGKRREFSFGFRLHGTEFEQAVYANLWKLPFGARVSYQELATLAGKPRASRAVGTAMRKNKLPILIPCHRVLRKGGKLGNYSGGVFRKRYLLDLEKSRE